MVLYNLCCNGMNYKVMDAEKQMNDSGAETLWWGHPGGSLG